MKTETGRQIERQRQIETEIETEAGREGEGIALFPANKKSAQKKPIGNVILPEPNSGRCYTAICISWTHSFYQR